MVLLSLCVPILNDLDNVKRLITCLKSQTDSNYEVVFVDGGSSDGTLEYLKKVSKTLPQIKVFSEEGELRSTANARNQAVKHATGDYVLIINADTILGKDFVKTVNRALRFAKDFDIVSLKRVYDYPKFQSFIDKVLFYRDAVVGSGVRSFIKRNKFPYYDPNLAYGEDRIFDETLRTKKLSKIFIGGDYSVLLNDYGLHTLSAFIKRYSWYGRTSFEYFKRTSSFKEKLTTLLGWLALPLFPIGILLGILKAFYRARFFKFYKEKSPVIFLSVFLVEFLTPFLFSFGALSRLWNPRKTRD